MLLAELKNQADNLRLLLIGSVEADLSKKEESKLAAMNTKVWLLTLRQRIAEIEEDTEEEFKKRRERVKLLVEKITVDRDEDGRAEVHIAYRFEPPTEESTSFVDGVQNTLEFLRARQGMRDRER